MILQTAELYDLRRIAEGRRLALRFGCYDILHVGHQQGIDFARNQAELLVVGVMSDAYVRKHKGSGRPINPEAARVSAVDAADGVDFSFIAPAGRLAVAGIIMQAQPDVYVEDTEYGHSLFKAGFLAALGIEYVIDSSEHPGSSSHIITALGIEAARAHSSMTYAPGD